jgi:hypothetical protein
MPSFGEVVERSLDLLERRGRVSHTALRLESDLDEQTLAALVEELVLVLGAADDDGRVLTGRAGIAPLARTAIPASSPDPALRAASATPGSVMTERGVRSVMTDAAASSCPRGPERAVLLCELVTTPPREALDAAARSTVAARLHAICDEVARRFDAQAQPWVADGIAIFFGHPRPHGD